MLCFQNHLVFDSEGLSGNTELFHQLIFIIGTNWNFGLAYFRHVAIDRRDFGQVHNKGTMHPEKLVSRQHALEHFQVHAGQ
jgi:hypothetical protein